MPKLAALGGTRGKESYNASTLGGLAQHGGLGVSTGQNPSPALQAALDAAPGTADAKGCVSVGPGHGSQVEASHAYSVTTAPGFFWRVRSKSAA